MEITLDLFGFTKKVDVPYDLYDRGEINVPLSYPLEELEHLVMGAEIKAADMEHSYMRFHRCEDDRWRPIKR